MPKDIFESLSHFEGDAPLAARMRPRTLDEFIGQDHILGEGRLLRRAIQADRLSSLIFFGPPGTGKTTLAKIIANHTHSHFMSINAVLSGIKNIRESIEEAKRLRAVSEQTSILFIDEVHRFNKAQQDALLPHVESGVITLIGATTENPYFEVNKALVSRSRIFQLNSLEEVDLKKVIHQALGEKGRGYGDLCIALDPLAEQHLIKTSGGDARSLLNALELAVETERDEQSEVIKISLSIAEESIQKRAVLYDKDGDAHYDTISAFIKSIRGSDSDAALYWMAKMLAAGEDPKFIFRRMIISASEDIGLAAPEVLSQVMAASQAYDYVGMPEGRFPLAQACLILSNSPKSNSTLALFDAIKTVGEQKDEVPNHLKDGSRDKEGLGHGQGYKYPHAYDEHWVAQQYLPDHLASRVFYEPSKEGFEKSIYDKVMKRREKVMAALLDNSWQSIAQQGQTSIRFEDEWQERALGDLAEQSELTRKLIFEQAQLESHHKLLDINAGTGFLSFEALRSIKTGGVWSVVFEKRDEDFLRASVDKMDFFSSPVVIASQKKHLANLGKRTELASQFDIILSRHLFDEGLHPKDSLNFFCKKMHQESRLILFDFIYKEDTRLHQLFSEATKIHPLYEEFKTLESLYFSSGEHPKLSYDLNSLTKNLPEQMEIVKSQKPIFKLKKNFSAKLIHSWFKEKSPFGQFMIGQVGEKKKHHFKELCLTLCGRQDWIRQAMLVQIQLKK